MAVTIKTYANFSKRKNSTKRPANDTGTSVTCFLKAPTSIESPTFVIDGIDSGVNYVYWNGRYYFVNDITILNSTQMQVSCTQDKLATDKNYILGTTAFVEYSSDASVYNTNILDSRISQTSQLSKSSGNVDFSQIFDSLSGSYIVTIIGQSGIATRYTMSYSELTEVGTFISTQLSDSVAETIVKRYGNAFQCITNCIWVPWNQAGELIDLWIGSENATNTIGHQFKRCTGLSAKSYTATINIPWVNSDISRRPSETICIYLPGYGLTQLSPSKYANETQLSISCKTDNTGCVVYTINNAGGTMDYFQVNLGTTVPITQYNMGAGSMLANAVSGNSFIANSIGGNTFFGQLYDIFNGGFGASGQVVQSLAGRLINVDAQVSSTGGYGSFAVGLIAASDPKIYITNYCFAFAETQGNMKEPLGRPVMKICSLASLTGYVKCNGASVDMPGEVEDKDEVNALLNSGIYIE